MVDIMTALATATQAIKLAQDLLGIETRQWMLPNGHQHVPLIRLKSNAQLRQWAGHATIAESPFAI
jgi:hypothetical protein